MKQILWAAAMLALAFVPSYEAATDVRDAGAKALADNEMRWNQEWASKDLERMVAHYADDAVLMAPGMPASTGRETIRTMLKEILADPAVSLKFHATKIEVSKDGGMAFTQGSYTMTMTDPSSKQVIHDHGSYVTTYRKESDGSWKAVADIANSEIPPAPAPKQ